MAYFYSPGVNGFYLTPEHIDSIELTDAEYRALIAGQESGETIVPGPEGRPVFAAKRKPSIDELVTLYETALDDHLDSVARQHRYRDRVTFSLRAGYPNMWRDQGTAFGIWMDECNKQAFALLAAVEAGVVALPTIEDFVASLPAFEQP